MNVGDRQKLAPIILKIFQGGGILECLGSKAVTCSVMNQVFCLNGVLSLRNLLKASAELPPYFSRRDHFKCDLIYGRHRQTKLI